MQRLRQARFLARLVLAWFALAIGAAIASPVVQPKSLEMVCSGGVMKVMAPQEGDAPPSPLALDCPLCGSADAPPPPRSAAAQQSPRPHVLKPVPAARLAARTAAPLPARGPPAHLPT